MNPDPSCPAQLVDAQAFRGLLDLNMDSYILLLDIPCGSAVTLQSSDGVLSMKTCGAAPFQVCAKPHFSVFTVLL